MPNYRAHGLRVASSRPLHPLVESSDHTLPDIQILFDDMPVSGRAFGDSIELDDRDELGAAEPWFEGTYYAADGRPGLVATRRGSGRWLQFTYADGPTFILDAAATTIRVQSPSDVTADEAIGYLLGPILGVALRLRGLTCLHASAVEIAGQACVFVGPAGAGKSTMAAAFADAGFSVLSDDTVTLRFGADTWWVVPGYPRLRLWPDAVRALRIAGRPTGLDAATSTRHHIDLAARNLFAREAVPLAVVYLIEFNESVSHAEVTGLSAADVLPELSANTFASRVLGRHQRADEFTALANMLEAIPVRRLARPQDLSALAAVRSAVLDDLKR